MKSRQKIKGRREGGTFFALPHAVLDSPNYLRLSYKAVKLLNDLGRQYNGYNNGDLCATYSIMRRRGWNSKSTLEEAIAELLHYGMIMLTRQGGRHQASLYALTWNPIDECKGKLEVGSTIAAKGNWKEDRPEFASRRKLQKN